MLVAGVIALCVGALLLWGSASAQRKLVALRTAERRSAAALTELMTQVAAEVGAGSWCEACEVEGTVECAAPLTAEVSGTACVYYASSVERQYEETVRENNQQRTQRGSETVAQNTQHVDFVLRDGSGAITVLPAGADFEARKTVERFEPASGGGLALTIGGARIELPALSGGRKTLGYKVVEHAIPVGARLYALGEAADRDGELVLRRPKDGRFILSLRSKEELVASSASQARWMKIAALVCFAGGAVLSVMGAVSR